VFIFFLNSRAIHTITLKNIDPHTAIRRIHCTVTQPSVFGGSPLIEFLADDDSGFDINNGVLTLYDVQPMGTRELKFRLFGVDPAATAVVKENQVSSGIQSLTEFCRYS
jgi:hypothetical protein